MTYNELKTRLSVVEKTLKKLQNPKDTKLSPTYIKETVNKLTTLKESIKNKLTLIKEEDGTVRTTDSREAEKLTKRGVNVDLVDKIEENEEDIEFSVNDMKVMITQVGKALAQALVNLGDELARVKAHRLETNSFDIHVIYKGERAGTDDEFAFHIEDGNLHLADFSFNKKLVDVGVKPSGEAFVNVDVLKNEFMKHFKSLNEEEVNEGPYQTTYIKVKRRDYKKAIGIIDSNIDSTFVTTDIVDDDGDGNAIIYFNFRDTTDDHRPGFETDNAAFIYDLSMDLKANDIEIMDHSHDLDSDKHMNEFLGRLAKWGASKLKAAGMSAVRGAAKGALKGAGVLEFVGKELEDRNDPLWKELVPGQGKAETVEGEMLRAINRMVYRFYNDGDKYFEGYGAETAGPAHAFLVDANHPLKSAMNKILDEPTGDASYERMLKDALDMILDHIESKQGKYTPNNVGDMFDYDSYFEDEEDDDDDYTYDYDDEEDDDYYNEEGLNEEDISKRKQAVKLIRQTLEDEGGAAGLEPLVKAVKGLGFDKEGLLKLLRKTVKVEKHKHGDYILTPINERKINEEVSTRFINKYYTKATPSDYLGDDEFKTNDEYLKYYEIENLESYSDRDKAILLFLDVEHGISLDDKLAKDIKGKSPEDLVKYFQDEDYGYMDYSVMKRQLGIKTPVVTSMTWDETGGPIGADSAFYYSTKHKRKLNKIWRTKYPELDIPKWNESFDNYDTRKKVAQELEDYYRDQARKQKGVDLEVPYEEYADMYVQALKDEGAI